MSIKNIPLSAAITVALFSWSFSVQANNSGASDTSSNGNSANTKVPSAENNNAVHKWVPQQSNNDFWQTPDWSNFQPSVNPTQAPAQPVPTNNISDITIADSTSGTTTTNTATDAAADSSAANSATKPQIAQNQAQANMPPMNMPPQMPGYRNNFQAPMPQGPYFNQPNRYNPYQRPFARPMNPAMQYGYRPYPPANMPPQGYRPPQNMQRPNQNLNQPPQNNRGAPPQGNPGNSSNPAMMPPPPAYNMPRYNGGNNRFYNGPSNWQNNNWRNNNFWGQSGPGTWTNPNKRNMEQGWDDMINAPSRMGTMPGGWNAPEISMPNPIDMGDQFQDNIEELPDQIRNMDVGNN